MAADLRPIGADAATMEETMGERILTDSNGDRWDAADADGGSRVRFSNPRGEEYEVASEKGVDELPDDDLVRMLDEARASEGEPPVGEGGTGGDPGGGY